MYTRMNEIGPICMWEKVDNFFLLKFCLWWHEVLDEIRGKCSNIGFHGSQFQTGRDQIQKEFISDLMRKNGFFLVEISDSYRDEREMHYQHKYCTE